MSAVESTGIEYDCKYRLPGRGTRKGFLTVKRGQAG